MSLRAGAPAWLSAAVPCSSKHGASLVMSPDSRVRHFVVPGVKNRNRPPEQTPTRHPGIFEPPNRDDLFTFASRNRFFVLPAREALGQRSRQAPAELRIAAGDAL